MRISSQLNLSPVQAWISKDNKYTYSQHLAEMQGVFLLQKIHLHIMRRQLNF